MAATDVYVSWATVVATHCLYELHATAPIWQSFKCHHLKECFLVVFQFQTDCCLQMLKCVSDQNMSCQVHLWKTKLLSSSSWDCSNFFWLSLTIPIKNMQRLPSFIFNHSPIGEFEILWMLFPIPHVSIWWLSK